MASSLAHSAGPAIVAISHPFGSISNVVGMPNARPMDLRSWKLFAAGVGEIGELLDADLLEPRLRLVGIARVDIDRHHFKSGAAEPLLKRIERRHLLAARHAPGGPEVEQHRAPAPVFERQLLAGGILKGKVGHLQRTLGNVNGRHLAMRKRRYFPGQFDSRAAGRVAARIACQGRNPVYPRQPNDDAGDSTRQNQGEALFGEA